MKFLLRVTWLFGTLAVTQLSFGQLIFATGFESPTYTLGDLGGQDDWMVTPSGAVGDVQNVRVQSGDQALELIDDASFGRAQRSVAGTGIAVLSAQFGMYFDDSWAANQVEDRFEAQMRVESTGQGGVFGIEFGFVKASASGYETVPANGSAFYIEIGTEAASHARGYEVVDFGAWSKGWHTYSLIYDNAGDRAKLYVDDVLKLDLASSEDILALSNIQLQNQRWGTNPQNNGSLFYDNMALSAVPEPASLAALAVGAIALLRRRR